MHSVCVPFHKIKNNMICFRSDSWWLNSNKALVFWTIFLMAMCAVCTTSVALAESSSDAEQKQLFYYVCYIVSPIFVIALWGFCETYLRIHCC